MRFTLLLLAVFVDAINCCLPPGFTFDDLNNATRIEEKMSIFESGAATGWTHVVGSGSPLQTWPAGDDDRVTIPYCFANERFKSFQHEGNQIQSEAMMAWAWKTWSMRLGSHSSLNGFKQVTKDGNPLYCRNPDGTWNEAVPYETLEVIFEGAFGGGYAVLGYIAPG